MATADESERRSLWKCGSRLECDAERSIELLGQGFSGVVAKPIAVADLRILVWDRCFGDSDALGESVRKAG